MNKVHTRINWENYPSDATPINEDNLNAMDVSIDEIDNRVVEIDASKATKTEVASVISNVTFDEKTGVFTFTRKNGTSFTVNTLLEKIATNFTYDYSTQTIILTLVDGTTQTIDLSALITQYEFTDSSTIDFTVDSNGKVSAKIINGSITDVMLESGYLSKVTTQANTAKTNATKAQSYAVGGTNSRDGEDTDNAKHYYTKSKEMFDTLVGAGDIDTVTTTDTTLAGSKGASAKINAIRGNSVQNGTPTADVPVDIESSGDSGSITVKGHGKNIIDFNKAIEYWGMNSTYENDAFTYSGSHTLHPFSCPYKFTDKAKNVALSVGSIVNTTTTNFRIGLCTVEEDGTISNRKYLYAGGRLVTTANAVYLDWSSSGTATIKEIQIALPDASIEYTPYQGESTFTIPLSEPLRGIDDVKDEIVKQDGVWGIYRRIKNASIKDIIQAWAIGGKAEKGYQTFYARVSDMLPSSLPTNIASDKFTVATSASAVWDNPDGYLIRKGTNESVVYVSVATTDASTVAEMITWTTNNLFNVQYELATPTFEPFADEYQSLFYQLETYDNVTYITTDSEVQPTIEVEYAVTDAGAHMLNNYAKSNLAELKVEEANKESTTADIWKHDNITNNSISLVKVGRLVMFSVNFTLSKNGSGGMSLFRLPEGYRPMATVYGSLNVAEDVPKYVFEIFENGYVGVDGIPEAETYKMTATFICEK